MQFHKQEVFIPIGAFCLITAAATAAGSWAGMSAMAGALAILGPQLWHLAAVKQLLRRRAANLAAQILRSRMWHFSVSVIGLAVGLKLLGANIVALAWIGAIIVQVLAAPLAAAIMSARDEDK